MRALQGKNILLGICGGIAAYKCSWLIRDLQRAGATIRVVLTESAEHFVSPLTLQALSGFEVRSSRFDPEAERAMSHIELARWADYLLIAPATANTVARMAHGMADDLLTTVYMATEAPVIVCPAMNRIMWQHTATQGNLQVLQTRGVVIVPPESGEQACGESGAGRLPESTAIIAALEMRGVCGLLSGKSILITAGPTREAIDPVRYISNHSSGKMGYALAQAAALAGADVTLISGPVALATPAGVQRVDVVTALDMHQAVMTHMKQGVIIIACAAVADYRLEVIPSHKIKKQSDKLSLNLVQNPDIIAEAAALKKAALVMGFAAETQEVLPHARAKRLAKKLDYIIANEVGADKAFDQDDNSVTIIGENVETRLENLSKNEIAARLVAFIAQRLQNTAH